MRHYLDLLAKITGLQRQFLRTWAMGALTTLRDELQPGHYFDHAPILEMVFHLRNGNAHGNRFHINKWVRSNSKSQSP
ncbi:hypothetical protein BSU04_12785 [Caballeronia sordidicola]|uniref:Uncharacterized protein n=1 Tax=Caballeronia sordidicola TaxID=196367 RepID=A0A226X474_CABSO|nr:hypothetical protein BSU04_12785 [Caballeronia sordidicola]